MSIKSNNSHKRNSARVRMSGDTEKNMGGGVLIKIIILLIGVSIVVGTLYWMTESGAFRITTIEVRGNYRLSGDDIKIYIDSLMTRRRMLLLNQRSSLFIVDTERLRTRLVEHYALKNADVEPVLPHTLKITIDERVPAFMVRATNTSVIIDNEGVIIATQDGGEPEVTLPLIIVPNSIVDTSTGTTLLDRSVMVFMNDIINAYSTITQNYHITEINVSRALVHDITLTTNEGWRIYMTDELSPASQFLNVDRALRDMKEERKRLVYIDVRLATKIFYK